MPSTTDVYVRKRQGVRECRQTDAKQKVPSPAADILYEKQRNVICVPKRLINTNCKNISNSNNSDNFDSVNIDCLMNV